MANPLSVKHEAFCQEYIRDLNAGAAYKRVYPKSSLKTAETNGPKLLRKAQIKDRVKELMQGTFEEYKIDRVKILKELELLATVNMAEALNEDGSMKKVSEMPLAVQKALSGIDTQEIYEGTGQDRVYVGDLKKIKLFDKTRSLEMLGRHLKLFTDVVEHKFTDALADRLSKARSRIKK